MRICGIELKANTAVLTVLEKKDDDIVIYIDLKIKKINLEDDENQENIRSFCNEFLHFLEQNKIEKIALKKRAKKGNFAGGAVSFKMEALIQLNPKSEVTLISSSKISSYEKKNEIIYPSNLKKYQENTYLTVLASI